jgi:guanine deaminase
VSRAQTILGPILNPRDDGKVDFISDGAISCGDDGNITFIGEARQLPPPLASSRKSGERKSDGLILPPFLDCHTHVPQFPIRGHFMDGIGANPPEGRLIAGLNRNVFPAEAKCADPNPAEFATGAFRRDTLAQGVVGGAAYVTVHPTATRIALAALDEFWSAGMVLMNMNCPEYLRTGEASLERNIHDLAHAYGQRFIVTDRFALCVDTPLRKRGVRLASELGLRTQAHLNEQLREKEFVEKSLYPNYDSYTDVYLRDGLLDHRAILAHCIHMRPQEWDILAKTGSSVAHCPTSNTLLGSGIMPLNEILDRGIEYAICTDMGASPTTSMLAEMAQFLKVHAGRCDRATPTEALYRATLAPAKILNLDQQLGSFEVGKPLSLIESGCNASYRSAEAAILRGLLDLSKSDLARYTQPPYRDATDELQAGNLQVGEKLDLLDSDVRETAGRMETKVMRVTLGGVEFRHCE